MNGKKQGDRVSSRKAVAVILSGGMSTRMGFDKTLIEINGVSLLDRLGSELSRYFETIIFSIRHGTREQFAGNGERRIIIEDEISGQGPIGGMYSTMKLVKSELYFITACDMPFPNGQFARRLIDIAENKYDVVIPLMNNGHLHPLHAVYRRTCLKYIDNQLKRNNNKIIDFFNQVNIRYIKEREMKHFDRELCFLENVNTREDLRKVRKYLVE